VSTQRHRLSLWKRALLHGLKTLVRRHPRAALHAAGATAVYAGHEVVHEGADFVKEKIEHVGHALRQRDGAQGVSKEEARSLVEKLSPEERGALAALASTERRSIPTR
jgi:hypothetical protein